MVFSSLIFVFIFLPVVLVGNVLLPKNWQNIFLLVASLFFYAWGETVYVGIMLFSICLNYGFGRWVSAASKSGKGGWVLAGAIAADLALLGYFKYASFLFALLTHAFPVLGLSSVQLKPIHLPIGISFFTFQAISYLVDVYRQEVPVQKNPLELGLYISLFPQLIAGPIIRYHDVARELRQRQVNVADFSYGIGRFIQGLAKKVLLANVLAVPVDRIFALPSSQLTLALSWLGTVGYCMQIYYDFSGYSDMAIGIGRMLGFHYLENFDHPYIAQSVSEFWRRWHISLSNWFRDYLYIPLGGNRRGRLRTYFNLSVVFLLCGLWHGASWNFVLWGGLHGLFMVAERAGLGRVLNKIWRPIRHIYLLLFILLSWVVFRAETLTAATTFWETMLGFRSSFGPTMPVFYLLTPEVSVSLIAGLIISVPYPLTRWRESWCGGSQSERPAEVWPQLTLAGGHILLLLLSLSYLSANAYNPFIYFRF